MEAAQEAEVLEVGPPAFRPVDEVMRVASGIGATGVHAAAVPRLERLPHACRDDPLPSSEIDRGAGARKGRQQRGVAQEPACRLWVHSRPVSGVAAAGRRPRLDHVEVYQDLSGESRRIRSSCSLGAQRGLSDGHQCIGSELFPAPRVVRRARSHLVLEGGLDGFGN